MFKLLKEKLKKLVNKSQEKIEKSKESIFKKTRRIGEKDVESAFKEIEIDLVQADVAIKTIEAIKQVFKQKVVGKEVEKKKIKQFLANALKQTLLEILNVGSINLIELAKSKKPFLVVFLGFNGNGKTTSLAKLAYYLLKNNKTVVMAAADTFRAASIEQLEHHAKKLGVKLIKHKYGADPAAVIYDAVNYAKSKGIDFVLADTAGRSHANVNLMEEMKKIIRVNKPDLKVLVIDSLTGNDAVNQAESFNKIGVDAIVFTKLDVNEKGGAIISVINQIKKPVLFLGTGQRYEDMKPFDAEKIVEMLVE